MNIRWVYLKVQKHIQLSFVYQVQIKNKSDKSKDFRGFSIKLLNVYGDKYIKDEKHTQDFLFVNNETPPLKNLKLFHDAIYYTTKSKPFVFGIKFLFKSNLGDLFKIFKNLKSITSPLDVRYYSTTPFIPHNKLKTNIIGTINTQPLSIDIIKASFDLSIALKKAARTILSKLPESIAI